MEAWFVERLSKSRLNLDPLKRCALLPTLIVTLRFTQCWFPPPTCGSTDVFHHRAAQIAKVMVSPEDLGAHSSCSCLRQSHARAHRCELHHFQLQIHLPPPCRGWSQKSTRSLSNSPRSPPCVAPAGPSPGRSPCNAKARSRSGWTPCSNVHGDHHAQKKLSLSEVNTDSKPDRVHEGRCWCWGPILKVIHTTSTMLSPEQDHSFHHAGPDHRVDSHDNAQTNRLGKIPRVKARIPVAGLLHHVRDSYSI